MENTSGADIGRLKNILKATGKRYDMEKIERAYEYAKKLHEGQFRMSGDPYVSHPIAVAEIVAGLELDTDSICAALLHDTVEDCSDKTNLKEIEKLFALDIPGQVNFYSLLPFFGRNKLLSWMKSGHISAIGSDIHNLEPGYKGFDKALKIIGKENVSAIMEKSRGLLNL